jgi:hypothetical protein
MKSYLTLTFLFISFSLIAQDAWFKHLNGFSAYKSFIQNDTIYTFGNKISYFRTYERYNATFDKTRIDGSQIHSDTISLDYLESDSLRSTLLRYPNSTVFHENDFSLGLSLSGNNKIDQVYITNFSKNMELLDTIKCTKDTFKTAIENIKFVNNHLIVAGFYSQSPTLLTSNLTTFIQYHDGKRVQWIKTYPQEPNNTRWRFINMISEKGKPFFFFDLQKQWDFRGSPEQWEDYIIKIDTLGNELWRCQPNNRYDINPTGMQMVQKPNGNLLVSWCDEYYRPYMDPNGPSQLSQLNRNCTLWWKNSPYLTPFVHSKLTPCFLFKKVGQNPIDLYSKKG